MRLDNYQLLISEAKLVDQLVVIRGIQLEMGGREGGREGEREGGREGGRKGGIVSRRQHQGERSGGGALTHLSEMPI